MPYMNFNPARKTWGHKKAHLTHKSNMELAVWQRYRWSAQHPAASINCTLAYPSCCLTGHALRCIFWLSGEVDRTYRVYSLSISESQEAYTIWKTTGFFWIYMSPVVRKNNNEKFINLNSSVMGIEINSLLCDKEINLPLLWVYGWGRLFVFLVLFWALSSSSAVWGRWPWSVLTWLRQGHFVGSPQACFI